MGVWRDAQGVERPRAVAEYLLARMARAGADRVLMVVAPGKTDLIRYFGAAYEGMAIAYAIQPAPLGLCDALFRAVPYLQADEPLLIGLPDTIWFPEQALAAAPRDRVHTWSRFPWLHRSISTRSPGKGRKPWRGSR